MHLVVSANLEKEARRILQDCVVFCHAMKANINQHVLNQWITAIKQFLMKSFHIRIHILPLTLARLVKLS